jgi:transaldolase
MEFFVDSGVIEEFRKAASTGLLDGCTTNPSLLSKNEKRPLKTVIQEILSVVQGPTSVEVIATQADEMLREAEEYLSWGEHVVVKVPSTVEGLKACRRLSQQKARVNVTLCFQPIQALAAAKCGAAYISPFLGRLDDVGQVGLDLIDQIRQVYDIHGYSTQILAASIRSVEHVTRVALAGADVATMPYPIFEKMLDHPLTQIGLDKFLSDWSKR